MRNKNVPLRYVRLFCRECAISSLSPFVQYAIGITLPVNTSILRCKLNIYLSLKISGKIKRESHHASVVGKYFFKGKRGPQGVGPPLAAVGSNKKLELYYGIDIKFE
jgi:hypothetical protein